MYKMVFVNYTYDMVNTQFHKFDGRSFARVLSYIEATKLDRFVLRFACKMKPSRVFFASSGAFSGIFRGRLQLGPVGRRFFVLFARFWHQPTIN